MPALVLRPAPSWSRLSCALRAAAFSPDDLNVSCSSCPFAAGAVARSSWHRLPGWPGQKCCSTGTVPQGPCPGWGQSHGGGGLARGFGRSKLGLASL